MRRTFYDADLREWEAYVSGGQPGTDAAARIYFLCLSEPNRRARFVAHDTGDVAAAERELLEMEDDELLAVLEEQAEVVP